MVNGGTAERLSAVNGRTVERLCRIRRTEMRKGQVYDGIIIGGGHNAMVCAGYLAKAGLKVLLIERHLEVGGGLDSHENPRFPGFWHNVHSNNHRGLPALRCCRAWGRAELAQKYIPLPVSVAMLTR